MKWIAIQIQGARRSRSLLRLLGVLTLAPEAREIRVVKGPVSQMYVNLCIRVQSVTRLWSVLGKTIRRDKVLSRHAIVTCEGRHGWDDYELMYHWDQEQIGKKWKQVRSSR